jgi:hypothetical protein
MYRNAALDEGHLTADTIRTMDAPPESLSIGRFGRIEAIGLTGPDGDHALLIRRGPAQRALLTADAGDRLIVTPLDDEVDIRVDGSRIPVSP